MAFQYQYQRRESNIIADLWNSFWDPPDAKCPKCGSSNVEYYDPFFFSPVRTIQGRRRIRCRGCHFIWRPNRKTKSMWDKLKS